MREVFMHAKNHLKLILLILSLLIINSQLLIGTVRYVSHEGSNTPPYTSWKTGADSIMSAINVSEFGDTIYVANGVYEEQVVMIPGLSLIGAGADSCLIDTRQLVNSWDDIAVEVADSCLLKGFKIIVSNNLEIGWGIAGSGSSSSLITMNRVTSVGIGVFLDATFYPISDITVYKNIFENVGIGIDLFNSNAIVRSNFIYTYKISGINERGIYIGAFDFSYKPTIDSNYIVVEGFPYTAADGIYKSFGAKPVITNNIIILKGVQCDGIYLSDGDSAWVYNNLIVADPGRDGLNNFWVQYLQLYNNYFTGNFVNHQFSTEYVVTIGLDNVVKNNVITGAGEIGVRVWPNENPVFQYNDVWNNNINYYGITPDSTNLSVDPMVVNEDSLDFHLQMFSPLIDAGDPDIVDKDGSRSDVGLYGGSYGWTYTYQDLAPRPPHNLTAVIEDGFVKLTWDKNTEADFSHYRIYRDTVTIVIYDSSKLAGETPDTAFYDNLPPVNKETRFYYVITAFDNQGNQSYPSEEINVLVTGMNEHPPKGYDGYRLLSNYPNPFNPSTKIPYRLKEAGYVKLYIYDIKGELVRVLVNEWQEKGYYEVLFHPNAEERSKANSFAVPMGKTYSDIATGVYIYTIQVYNGRKIPVYSDSGKMILLK
jgi:hypothetical protein